MHSILAKSALFVLLTYGAGTYATFNVNAGFLGLGLYVSTYGTLLWGKLFDACKEVGPSFQTWTGTNCIANMIFYLVGAATSFGLGLASSEYITEGGVTSFGKRELGIQHHTWDWERVQSHPEGLYKLLGNRLPGEPQGIHHNVTGINLDNSVTVVKSDGQNYYLHSNNITHGIVSMVLNATSQPLEKRQGYSWTFGDMAGVKFSYGNPGCMQQPITDSTFDAYLGQVTLWAAQWMKTNLANSYGVTLSNQNLFGSPYVSGFLIAEENSFGHNYEGSPGTQDCYE